MVTVHAEITNNVWGKSITFQAVGLSRSPKAAYQFAVDEIRGWAYTWDVVGDIEITLNRGGQVSRFIEPLCTNG